MKPSRPPRLAVALLHRLVADNEPLVGDLLEEFRSRGRSRLWFWRQALLAVVLALFHGRRARRPLGLELDDSSVRRITKPNSRPVEINLSASPLPSWVGGLGLIALAVLVTVWAPGAWWLLLIGLIGGVLSGIAMVVISRRRSLSGSSGGHPIALFDRDKEASGRPASRKGS